MIYSISTLQSDVGLQKDWRYFITMTEGDNCPLKVLKVLKGSMKEELKLHPLFSFWFLNYFLIFSFTRSDDMMQYDSAYKNECLNRADYRNSKLKLPQLQWIPNYKNLKFNSIFSTLPPAGVQLLLTGGPNGTIYTVVKSAIE